MIWLRSSVREELPQQERPLLAGAGLGAGGVGRK
jgi:hypothetical protein